MTNAPNRAPATVDLYAGCPLLENSVAADLLQWLADEFGVVGCSVEERRQRCSAQTGNPDVVEICLTLFDAASSSDKMHGLSLLRETMQRAYNDCGVIMREEADGAEAAELRIRLLPYLSETHSARDLPDFAREAAFELRGRLLDAERSDAVLLVVGLSLATAKQIEGVKSGHVRRHLIEWAKTIILPKSAWAAADAVCEAQRARSDQAYADFLAIHDRSHRALIDDDRPEFPRSEGPDSRVVVPTLPPLARKAEGPRVDAGRVAGVPLPLHPVPRDLGIISARLRARAPHARAAHDALLGPLWQRRHVRLDNVLLVGPPGVGKTEIATGVAKGLGVPSVVYGCSSASDSAFAGTSAGWATARMSVPLQMLVSHRCANGVVVLDELEKSGQGFQNGNFASALLPFLETATSRCLHDIGLDVAVDLSGVSYVATANTLAGIPKPLVDRFLIVEVPEPTWEHVGDLARGIVERLRQQRETSVEWLPDLDPEEIEMLGQHWRGGSIRRLRKLVEVLVNGRDHLAPRH